MLKLLLLVIGAWLVFSILSHQRRRNAGGAPPPTTETMVRCETCGVFVPQSEAIVRSGHHYCCEAHATPPARPI
ncbi:MAG: PP0621 family protein [Methylophilaceae bacterium]|nr:PP0621 family protein [Methylophilaceae bacterium]